MKMQKLKKNESTSEGFLNAIRDGLHQSIMTRNFKSNDMKTLTISSSNKVCIGAERIKDLAENLNNNWYVIKGAKKKIEYWISDIRYTLDKIESQLIGDEE